MGHFSRSQSDLHNVRNAEVPPLPMPSPNMDFPRSPNSGMIALSSSNMDVQPGSLGSSSGTKQAAGPYLRSPSQHFSFSRSVDDLGQLSSPVLSSSPGMGSAQSPMMPPAHQHSSHFQRLQHSQHSRTTSVNAGQMPNGAAANISQSPLSPTQQQFHRPAVPPIPTQHYQGRTSAQHGRKSSRLPFGLKDKDRDKNSLAAAADKDGNSGGSQGRSSSLASSLGINTSQGSSTARQISSSSIATSILSSADSQATRGGSTSPQSVSIPLPPGVAYQGMLNRNTNISLSFAQLTEGREKDISKGWKPYKVVLQDGNLQFYKPAGALAEEAKAIFPTSIVRPPARKDSFPNNSKRALTDQYAGIAPLDAEALKRSGLNTRDLLAATSSSSAASASPNSQKGILPPMESPTFQSLALPRPAMSRMATAETSLEEASWHNPGHHAELVLIAAQEDPGSWAMRIQSGSLPALAHELIHATQCSKTLSSNGPITVEKAAEDADQESLEFIQTLLLSAARQEGSLAVLLDEIAQEYQEVQGAERGSALGCEGRIRKLLSCVQPELIAEISKAKVLEALRGLCDAVQETVPSWVEAFEKTASRANDSSPAQPSNRSELRPLLNGSFSDGLLVTLPPQEIAQQIQSWHAHQLRDTLHPYLDVPALLAASAAERQLLCFSPKYPHPITELVLEQVFPAQRPSAEAQSPAAAQASARHRAAVLRHWIAVASYLQAHGDMVGWTAVVVALCSRAVARLESAWRFVAPGDKEMVAKSWIPSLTRIGWTETQLGGDIGPIFTTMDAGSAKSPDGESVTVIPYFGDVHAGLPISHTDDLPIAGSLSTAKRIDAILQLFRRDCSPVAQLVPFPYAPISPLLKEYESLFDHLRKSSSRSVLVSHLQRSYAAEPRRLGGNDLSWRQRPGRVIAANAINPLLFSNALPLFTIADPTALQKIAQGDASSVAPLKEQDGDTTITHRSPGTAAILRSKTLPFSASMKQQDRRNPFVRVFKRSGAELDESTLLKIGTELVLRPIGEFLTSSSNASPRGSKRFSQDFVRSSRPVSHSSRRSSLPASNRNSVTELGTTLHVEVKAATLERLSECHRRLCQIYLTNAHLAPPSRRNGDGC